MNLAQRVCAALSLLLCLLLAALFALRPPFAGMITVYPLWGWAVPGILLGLLALSRQNRRPGLAVLGLWLVVVAVEAEEPRYMARLWWQQLTGYEAACPDEMSALRVVTLNCDGGNPRAAAEVLPFSPDIVLLQESPAKAELQDVFPAEDGWEMTVGPDASIIVRGTLEPVALPLHESGTLTLARVQPSAVQPPVVLTVISTRFFLPPLRLDLWNDEARFVISETVAVRTWQMERVAEYAFAGVAQGPTIAGGDFNTPGGDALFRRLKPHLRDAWPPAGVGWPNTIINERPFSRIDQVWISRHLKACHARVHRTMYSDHRMVVFDLALAAAPAGD